MWNNNCFKNNRRENTSASTFHLTLAISKLPKVQYSNFQYPTVQPIYAYLTFVPILFHICYLHIYIYILYTFNSNTSYKTKKEKNTLKVSRWYAQTHCSSHYHVIGIAINERLSCYHPRRPHVLSQRGFLSSSWSLIYRGARTARYQRPTYVSLSLSLSPSPFPSIILAADYRRELLRRFFERRWKVALTGSIRVTRAIHTAYGALLWPRYGRNISDNAARPLLGSSPLKITAPSSL